MPFQGRLDDDDIPEDSSPTPMRLHPLESSYVWLGVNKRMHDYICYNRRNSAEWEAAATPQEAVQGWMRTHKGLVIHIQWDGAPPVKPEPDLIQDAREALEFLKREFTSIRDHAWGEVPPTRNGKPRDPAEARNAEAYLDSLGQLEALIGHFW
jgi:hypothetical protein